MPAAHGADRRQQRDQHQPGAVGHGHQEGPGAEARQAGGHAEADPVAVAVQAHARWPSRSARSPPARRTTAGRGARRRPSPRARPRAPPGAWPSAIGTRATRTARRLPLVQAQRHREQPAHGRVEAVEGAQPGQGQPGPDARVTRPGSGSRVAVGIRRAVAALEPDLVRQVALRPVEEELLVEARSRRRRRRRA